MYSTHRIIQVSTLLETVQARASLLRRVASKAANLGKRVQCNSFLTEAQKCDSIANRCYLVLGRDFYQRKNAA